MSEIAGLCGFMEVTPLVVLQGKAEGEEAESRRGSRGRSASHGESELNGTKPLTRWASQKRMWPGHRFLFSQSPLEGMEGAALYGTVNSLP